eukprot:SM000008S22385  [mRNA]  locus=s8:1324312:1326534:- [translate_table: standard]
MLPVVDCGTAGRTDTSFQPYGCNITSFNAHAFLTLLKNKKLAVVGDSLGRWNFFTSLLCLVSNVATPVKTTTKPLVSGRQGDDYLIPVYNVRLIAIQDAFLVASKNDNKSLLSYDPHATPGINDAIVNPYRFPNPAWASLLDQLDVVVMNTAAHWGKNASYARRYYVDRNWALLPDQDQAAMQSMRLFFNARQLQSKGPVPIFLSVSPQHGSWKVGNSTNTVCNATGPLTTAMAMQLRKQVKDYQLTLPLERLALKGSAVELLEISTLSIYRPDAHVGPWYAVGGHPTTPYQDCLHWCNPGVPDIWSDLLYAMLLRKPSLRR